jgi:hypothetical protein
MLPSILMKIKKHSITNQRLGKRTITNTKMPTRRSELKDRDLVRGEPLVCPSCQCYMVLDERLKNGKSKVGVYRRRKFKCLECGHTDLIHADGGKDVQPFRQIDEQLKAHRKSELDDRHEFPE